MRTSMLLLTAGVTLFLPEAARSQAPSPEARAYLMATASGFRDWDCPDQGWRPAGWRPAGTVRARMTPLSFVHLEVAYSYSASKDFTFDEDPSAYSGGPCLSSGVPCGAHSGASHSFTGGLGFQLPGERWRPFAGFGYGTSQGNPLRVGYLGLEFALWEDFGFMWEYRVGRQDHGEHAHRTHELGTGIVWTFRRATGESG